MKKNTKNLSADSQKDLLATLQKRFEKHPSRHKDLTWEVVQKRILAYPDKLMALYEMEETGGEPDVVSWNSKTGEVVFFDCSEESPKGRRSVCYDRAGWESRKEHQPEHTAMDMAEEMGVTMLNEEEYRMLQTLGKFDLKTSSWLITPPAIRKHGGAIFGDRRYDHVFIYHNGAQSYYAARGFRASLTI